MQFYWCTIKITHNDKTCEVTLQKSYFNKKINKADLKQCNKFLRNNFKN